MSRTPLLFVLMSLVSFSLWADVIVLQDGARVVGEIIEETADSVKMKLKSGVVFTYERSNIKSVEKGRATTGQSQGGSVPAPASPSTPSGNTTPPTPSTAPSPTANQAPAKGDLAREAAELDRRVTKLKEAKFAPWSMGEDVTATREEGKDGDYKLVKLDGSEQIVKEKPASGDGLSMIWVFQNDYQTTTGGHIIIKVGGDVNYWWRPLWWDGKSWKTTGPESSVYYAETGNMDRILEIVMNSKIPNYYMVCGLTLAHTASKLENTEWSPQAQSELRAACEVAGGKVGMADLLYKYFELDIQCEKAKEPAELVKLAEAKRAVILQFASRK